jgi:hypothetical protein
MQTTSNPNAALVTIVMLCFVTIAISRSQRRLHTALYILGVILLSGLVGAGIGLLRSPELAGSLAALAMQLAGIAASIERLLRK